jgi:hypothetical protein
MIFLQTGIAEFGVCLDNIVLASISLRPPAYHSLIQSYSRLGNSDESASTLGLDQSCCPVADSWFHSLLPLAFEGFLCWNVD